MCGAEYGAQEQVYTCLKDGGNLDVVLDFAWLNNEITPKDIKASTIRSIWRYAPLIPVNIPPGRTPLHTVGGTPIFELPEQARKLGIKSLFVKDESRNPTASFKDRASAVVAARALDICARVIITASTGNAGAAMAGMAAATGQRAVIIAPRTAPKAKVAQLVAYGAQVVLVDGNYDAAFDLAVSAAKEFGWYCRNTGFNPFTLEGKKTAALELWEKFLLEGKEHKQLSIVVSVGDGNIISGIHKGFKDLLQLGWIEQIPRIYGVQSKLSASVYNAFVSGTEEILPVQSTTIADSISVDLPRDGLRAVRAAKETGGRIIAIDDQQILAAIGLLGKVGIFAEPAGAAGYAGFLQLAHDGEFSSNDEVVVINTGSGLKDIQAVMKIASEPPVIQPDLVALKATIG